MTATLASSQEVDSTAANTTSLVSSAITVANGDVLVVKTASENAAQTLGTPSGGGQTWTKQDSIQSGGTTAPVLIATCVVSGSPGTVTVTTTFTGASGWHSMVVERWTGAKLAGTPALVTTGRSGSGAPSGTLTTVAAASIVSWVSSDFSARSPAGAAYRSGATQDGLHNKSTNFYVAYYATQVAPTAGAQTLGLTAPSTQTWSMVGVEIQDNGGSLPSPNFFPFL